MKYIIDFGTASQDSVAQAAAQAAAQKRALAVQKFEALKAQNLLKKQLKRDQLTKCLGRQKMIDHFVKRCNDIVQDLNKDNVVLRSRLFYLEQQQFGQGLPMYARKAEFLKILKSNQACVLKGGTGIGKTVTVPQWVYDHTFCEESGAFSKSRVAVLVPRKAIAIGLAGYISSVRKVKLGQEIGLGTGDGVNFSAESRLVFMTYGFFQAITQSDQNFSKWDAVILDEAHERNPSADILLARMAATCKERKKFKAIIMSATIDVKQFAEAVTAGIKGEKITMVDQNTTPLQTTSTTTDSETKDDGADDEYKGTPECPVIVVPGVTYPVEDIWCSASDGRPAWDPEAAGALNNLAIEVLKIYRNEKSGNVLIFLPTIRDVTEACEITQKQMKHDKNCIVRPLYAAVDEWEKDEITEFCDYDRFPDNKEKRLICFSTNVAEAGITIPGITAVVETGREICMVYDLDLKVNRGSKIWISKASQTQRRGRAGRTAPGKCYCLYSKEDYEKKMPQYATAAVNRMNLDEFYLSLVASGVTPEKLELLDKPKDRMLAARTDLIKVKAIELEDDASSLSDTVDGIVPIKITQLGKAMNRLPLSLHLSKCVIASCNVGGGMGNLRVATLDKETQETKETNETQETKETKETDNSDVYGCTEQMCKIVCMVQATTRGGLFIGGHDEIKKNTANFVHVSGDHQTLLNVYDSWLDNNKDEDWCEDMGIDQTKLFFAEAALKKVHKSLHKCGIPFAVPRSTDNISDLILTSLCMGL